LANILYDQELQQEEISVIEFNRFFQFANQVLPDQVHFEVKKLT